MTQFIDVSQEAKKQKKETVFNSVQTPAGWSAPLTTPQHYDKVIYLGSCVSDGDMFAAYKDGYISIFKGAKGDEFNNQ